MESVGLYMPRWLYWSDRSDRTFFKQLQAAIAASGRYEPIEIDLESNLFSSQEEVDAFCADKNLVAIVQHHSVFYSKSPHYKTNISFLERRVRLINSMACHQVAHDKVLTKQVLRQKGVPVLDGASVASSAQLKRYMEDGKLYVIKPVDRGAGEGVQLIKRLEEKFLVHYNNRWHEVEVADTPEGVAVVASPQFPFFPFFGKQSFVYSPMLVEPFFNDSESEFASLRCTVVGAEVVEAVCRVNRKNITSNVSRGGTARRFQLSDYQKEIAIGASQAVGADYAGVDLLVCGGKAVVCEVNIGPFTIYSKYTGAPVGKLFGEYVVKECEARSRA